MPPLKDIEDRNDIKVLVDSFYQKVLNDDVIGYIFNDVVKLNWEHHIPIMYDFWETTLFHKTIYKGNPIKVHQALNGKEPLNAQHFEQWLKLFSTTVDELFKGEKAELAKIRALSIATVIRTKIAHSSS